MSVDLLEFASTFDCCLKKSGRSCVTATFFALVQAEDEDGTQEMRLQQKQETAQSWEELGEILREAFNGSPFMGADDVERAMRSAMSDE